MTSAGRGPGLWKLTVCGKRAPRPPPSPLPQTLEFGPALAGGPESHSSHSPYYESDLEEEE